MTVRTATTARRVSPERLARIARRLLRASTLCALATVGPGGRAHINTMYFALARRFDIVWISAPDSRHSRNVRERRTAAIAVYDSRQRWGGRDRGIQVLGRAIELRGGAARAANALYAKRFRDADDDLFTRYRAYRLRPARLKLFDERELGTATWTVARVGADGALTWERTEVYVE